MFDWRFARRSFAVMSAVGLMSAMLIGAAGSPVMAASSHARSEKVLIVRGSAAASVPPLPQAGTVPGSAIQNFDQFTFTTADVSVIATLGPTAYDTIVLYQVPATDLGTPDHGVLTNFVTAGGKLIITDSDGTANNDYNWLPTPATTGMHTANSGNMGGTALVTENNDLVSADPTDTAHFVDLTLLPNTTDAIGDGNVMITQDPGWYVDIEADNGTDVGAIHTYATIGAGLVIFNGFDHDVIGASPGGVLERLWFNELALPWSPDTLPHTSPVAAGTWQQAPPLLSAADAQAFNSLYRYTELKPAAYYAKTFGQNQPQIPVTDELVSYTYNMATGRSKDNNISGPDAPLWWLRTGGIAHAVVSDLRSFKERPKVGNPAVVVLLQETRPHVAEEVALRMSVAFGRKVSLLYVIGNAGYDPATTLPTVSQVDSTRPRKGSTCSALPKDLIAVDLPDCEYGDAILTTSEGGATITGGVHFDHAKARTAGLKCRGCGPAKDRNANGIGVHGGEGRSMLMASIRVGSTQMTVGTGHFDAFDNRVRVEEYKALNLALRTKGGPSFVFGGDFNNSFKGGVKPLLDNGIKSAIPTNSGSIDFFLYRGLTRIALGQNMTKRLTEPPGYQFDHHRVAARFQG